MIGLPQFGITLGALGTVLMLMGLFPGVTGITPGEGIGIVQFSAIVSGAVLLNIGAIFYIKSTLYSGRPDNLTQQVCIRLSYTGLVLAGFTGLADYLGFGSHGDEGASFFGPLQAAVVLLFLMIAAVGVLLYALSGSPPVTPPPPPSAPQPGVLRTDEMPLVAEDAPAE